MSDFGQSLALSASALKAQSARLRHVAENISNADTPGYRRKAVSFENVTAQANEADFVTLGQVRLDQRELTRVYDPSHALADDSGHYESSNVDLMIEIADAREAQRSYEANLRMFDQARQMSTALMDLLRK